MNALGECGTMVCGLLATLTCLGNYPTLERAQEIFSPENISSPEVMINEGDAYELVNDLWKYRAGSSMEERLRMKDFFLTALTSVVVRVSTNVVDDGTVTYALSRDRGIALPSALESFQDEFSTNVTDCLAVAAYIDRVHPVPFSESLIWRRESRLFYSPNPEKMEAWERQRMEKVAREKPIRELQQRVYRANRIVLDYRRDLFDLCNACVLANRKVMDDTEFAAFTNRVVELSKPDEREKRRLFDHLGEVKRK